jgi:hypothetical protein
MQTSSIQEVVTELNYKRTQSKIQKDFDIIKGSFFSSDYVMFKVTTDGDGLNYLVSRTDDDFYELRKLLVIAYPHV